MDDDTAVAFRGLSGLFDRATKEAAANVKYRDFIKKLYYGGFIPRQFEFECEGLLGDVTIKPVAEAVLLPQGAAVCLKNSALTASTPTSRALSTKGSSQGSRVRVTKAQRNSRKVAARRTGR